MCLVVIPLRKGHFCDIFHAVIVHIPNHCQPRGNISSRFYSNSGHRLTFFILFEVTFFLSSHSDWLTASGAVTSHALNLM